MLIDWIGVTLIYQSDEDFSKDLFFFSNDEYISLWIDVFTYSNKKIWHITLFPWKESIKEKHMDEIEEDFKKLLKFIDKIHLLHFALKRTISVKNEEMTYNQFKERFQN